MINRKFLALTFCCVVLGQAQVTAAADTPVYKSVDEKGEVTYTDEPTGAAERVDLPPVPSVPPSEFEQAVPAEPAVADENQSMGYRQLEVIAPTPAETLDNNPGNIRIVAGVDPALNIAAGDRLQFYLDGKPVGEPGAADEIVIPNVDRGTHTASVAVIDATGNALQRSDAVQFFLHRQSINFPTRKDGAP